MNNEELLSVFKIMADETRLKIITALQGKEKNEKEIVEELGMLQSTIANHMGKLCQSGILTKRKEGKTVYFSISEEKVGEIRKGLEALLVPYREMEIKYTKGNPRGIVVPTKR